MTDNKVTYIKLWVAVFFYILIAGLFVQLVALPFVLPAAHAGDGLLAGGDWVAYHRIALDLADQIKQHGWSFWQLRPEYQAPAGIAAALYAITGIAMPWVILPFNAAIHATSAILLLLIIGSVAGWSKPVIWPVLPFTFFPTALLWNTQFHKDSFFILGTFLFLYGLLYLSIVSEHNLLKRLVSGFIIIFCGILFIWVVRPYGVEMIFYIGSTLAFFLTIYLLVSNRKNKKVLLANILFIWLAIFASYPFVGTGIHHQFVPGQYEDLSKPSEVDQGGQIKAVQMVKTQMTPAEPNTGVTITLLSAGAENVNSELQATLSESWSRSSYLPAFIDENLYKLAVMRDRYIIFKPEAGSNIDHHIRFTSAQEIITYIPRALQVGLFTPFPDQWFAEGTNLATTIMRRISALEMIFIYLLFPFLLIGWWLWRKNYKYYLAACFSLGMILSYALVVANVGTLVRMRYGFTMILVGLGVAAIIELIGLVKNNNLIRLRQ